MADKLISDRFSFSHCRHPSVTMASAQERLSLPDISHPFAASPPLVEYGGESAETLQIHVVRRIGRINEMPANMAGSGQSRRRFA